MNPRRRSTPRRTSTPRVLIISENESAPGDRRVWMIATALVRAGAEVAVICPQDDRDAAPYEVLEGVEVHRYRASFAGGGPLGYVREYGRALWCTWRLVARLSRERPFDAVHSCTPPDFLIAAAWPARWRGARLIFDHHDLTPELFRARYGERHSWLHRLTLVLERASLAFADVAIATNGSYAELQMGRGAKPPEDVFVVRNAPDLSRLVPGAPDPTLRRRKRFLIGYLGVMCDQDGVDLALRALAVLRRRRDDWHAVFAGDGSAVGELQALAEELGLTDMVEFTGWVGDDLITRLLSTADVCLSPEPKTPFNDVSTLVKIAEYMAMSRPIVAFPVAETVRTAGSAAVYAEANHPASFAERIDDLLSDPAARARMGNEGRSRVEHSLSWEHSLTPLEEAYRRALPGRSLRLRPQGDQSDVMSPRRAA